MLIFKIKVKHTTIRFSSSLKSKDPIIRYRENWVEEKEQSTKYFLNLKTKTTNKQKMKLC